jgi:hypothetical protein
VGGAAEQVQGDPVQQGRPVGEAAVQGGDAHAGTPGDLVEGRVGALLDDDVAGGGQEPLAVALGISPQPPRRRSGDGAGFGHPGPLRTDPEESSPLQPR